MCRHVQTEFAVKAPPRLLFGMTETWSVLWPFKHLGSAFLCPLLLHLLPHLLLPFAQLSRHTLPHLAPLSFLSKPLKFGFQKMLLFELMNHFSPGVVGWGQEGWWSVGWGGGGGLINRVKRASTTTNPFPPSFIQCSLTPSPPPPIPPCHAPPTPPSIALHLQP